ncbi:MAG: hypothetical protein VCD00_05600 [Candidatus Hydrogenedentota bacterium]
MSLFDTNGEFIDGWETQFDRNSGARLYDTIGSDVQSNLYIGNIDSRGSDASVQKFDVNGNFITDWCLLFQDDFDFSDFGIDVAPNGNVFVVDANNHHVQVYSSDGDLIRVWSDPDWSEERVPRAVALDNDGNVHITESMRGTNTSDMKIGKYTPEGELLEEWGEVGPGPGALLGPYSIAVEGNGIIYIADWKKRNVQKFVPRFRYPGILLGDQQ